MNNSNIPIQQQNSNYQTFIPAQVPFNQHEAKGLKRLAISWISLSVIAWISLFVFIAVSSYVSKNGSIDIEDSSSIAEFAKVTISLYGILFFARFIIEIISLVKVGTSASFFPINKPNFKSSEKKTVLVLLVVGLVIGICTLIGMIIILSRFNKNKLIATSNQNQTTQQTINQ